MNTSSPSQPVPSTISDVERDTGVAKETLRVWERRYDFPRPQRDAFGERVYSAEQVHKLRLVKRLIDLGYRPGKVIQFGSAELQAMAEQAAGRQQPVSAPHPELHAYIELCKTHQMEALRRKLSQAMLVMGLKNFVIELVAPLTAHLGEAWAGGQLAVFEEHLFSESLQIVMRSAIFSIPQAHHHHGAAPRPRILLATLPQERQGLGLLMAEAVFAADGAHCTSLGVQAALPDIVQAARSLHSDIVLLSFSPLANPRQVGDALKELRARLPEAMEIWASGSNAALRKRAAGAAQVYGLADLGKGIAEWRQRTHGQAA
ncbi:MerR family transcriptional regulator [Massilia sp. erpn]|uniref:MerR family transcriptional regulator n=1 Tax=Massilia sp. erpn TaxID=2738142 RepID=UPI0021058150|nr:MerR family transcriptional regulator [Massilia sp. erpn]UTY56290.1 MerR family transcriptional regulator [Massilia sp. erpn]